MGGLKDGLGGGTGSSTAKHEISDDIIVTGTNRIYFRDAGISLYSGADGKLNIESDGASTDDVTISGAVKITGDVEVNLESTNGTNQLQVKDSDGFPVSKLDSSGNVRAKGKLLKV